MWSCDHEMHSGHPVELTFHLPGVTPADDFPFGLSKICIWNYNRGMKVNYLMLFVCYLSFNKQVLNVLLHSCDFILVTTFPDE